MRQRIFYSALLLTGVNLLLRLVGTGFQVYLSRRIGAEGIGLLQLTMSVGNLSMVAAMAGIRTTAMYLCAGELGRKRPENVAHVLSGCFLYSFLVSGTVSAVLYHLAPVIAQTWIGEARTLPALRLLAATLPCACLAGVMTGYFTAAGRIGTLAAVEVAEQLISMAVTMLTLQFWAGADPGRACLCVVLGGGISSGAALLCLVFLRYTEHAPSAASQPLGKRLISTAVPLALADDLKSGITTAENLMVPKRLALYAGSLPPLAAFGTVSGMVFPVLMFPACILFALAELLIPELARCAAAGRPGRIRYLTRRSLRVSLLYGLTVGGLLFLCAEPLCRSLYQNSDAGTVLRRYALLAPMLYCNAITDAMTKGLGQQTACVRYNILTAALDIAFLYILLPKYGMDGYLFSFFLTHLLNFLLSLRRLALIADIRIRPRVPLLTLCAGLFSLTAAQYLTGSLLRSLAYLILLTCSLCLAGLLRREDIRWLVSLMHKK